MYLDAALVSPAAFQAALDGARVESGVDFYALGMSLDGAYFAAFDALTPWLNLGLWSNAAGPTLHDKAAAYTQALHAHLVGQLGSYPGRVMFGALAPGFDDYTENWGACQAREIPRDPAVLAGQADYLAQLKQSGFDLRGTFLETWDDWTEGSEFEPDVTEGTAKLIGLRQGLGTVFGDPADPAGEAALTARWSAFGQPLSCCFAGGACDDAGASPIAVACGPAGAGDAGSEGGADASPGTPPPSSGDATTDTGSAAEAPPAGGSNAGSCACRSAPAPARDAPFLLAVAVMVGARTRRRRGRVDGVGRGAETR
jgi:hypothetical protein